MSQVVGGGGSTEPEDPSAEGDDGGSPAKKAAGSAVAAARQGVAAAVESSASAARKVGDGAKSALDATTDTAARAKRTAGSAVAATREGAAAAAESSASAARRVGDGARSALGATTGRGAKALSAVQSLLATDTVATAVNAVVAAAVKGPATAYDKALDANYLDPVLRPALGGSYHRLFDGSHTVAGAFGAVRDVSVDAPIVEEALGTVHALLKDASTPRGLPLATWDKETFDAVASSLDSTFGIPRRWFYELNTYDTADLLGASVGVVSVVFCWKPGRHGGLQPTRGQHRPVRCCRRQSAAAGGLGRGVRQSLPQGPRRRARGPR